MATATMKSKRNGMGGFQDRTGRAKEEEVALAWETEEGESDLPS